MNADGELLLIDNVNGVVTLTLNRPDQFNALSQELLDALQRALADIAENEQVRCVVLAANGRAFGAGHDLKQMRANPDQRYYEQLFAQCGRGSHSIVKLPLPVIATVDGTATEAGCEVVASRALAIASDTVKCAVSGINEGLFCPAPAVALTRNVPLKTAFEMLMTGQ